MNSERISAVIVALAVGMSLVSCSAAPMTEAAPAVSASPTAEAELAPVSAIDLASGEQDSPVNVSVDGGADGVGVTFREITIKPGAGTGLHCHYGQLIAVVKEGALTHYAAIYPGGVHVYNTGDSIIEGAGYQHEGKNEGTTNVVLWVTYIIPEGKPLAETDLTKCE